MPIKTFYHFSFITYLSDLSFCGFKMPLLDHSKLASEQDWDRACLVLAAIGNGYVWQNGEDDPVKVTLFDFLIPIIFVVFNPML